MKFERQLLLAIASALTLTTPTTASLAKDDPYCGTFISKDANEYYKSNLRKIIISSKVEGQYQVKVYLSHYLTEDHSKASILSGLAIMYGSHQSKDVLPRMVVQFPKVRHFPRIELIPGQKSSPVANWNGYQTLFFTYFESSPRYSEFTTGELVRVENKKK